MPNQLFHDLEQRLTDRDRDLRSLSADEQFTLLSNRKREFVDGQRLHHQLAESKQTGRPLRVKYGIDPTASEIHLGHVVPIIVARRFQQMGHHVIIVIGDFTAFVGDPSGRVSTRPILTREQIAENVTAYQQQISRFIDIKRLEFVFNGSFYDPTKMNILDLFRVYRENAVGPLLQREDFRKRQQSGLTIAELLYPTLMAIDSVKLGADIELGGIDQLLNFQFTKTVMERQGLAPETALTTDLLQSTAGDGKKMSKSEGNFVSVMDDADQIFGKLMSIPDRLMEHYFKLLTDLTDDEWNDLQRRMDNGLSPKEVKQLLARVIVSWVHTSQAADQAEERFAAVFSRRSVPTDIPHHKLVARPDLSWATALVEIGAIKSKSAVRRLVDSKTIKLCTNNAEQPLDSPDEIVPPGDHVVRYGRGKYVRLHVS